MFHTWTKRVNGARAAVQKKRRFRLWPTDVVAVVVVLIGVGILVAAGLMGPPVDDGSRVVAEVSHTDGDHGGAINGSDLGVGDDRGSPDNGGNGDAGNGNAGNGNAGNGNAAPDNENHDKGGTDTTGKPDGNAGNGNTDSNAGNGNAGNGNAGNGNADNSNAAGTGGDDNNGNGGSEEADHASDEGDGGQSGEDSRATKVPCDPDRLIGAITLANTAGGRTLRLAHRCLYILTTNQADSGLPTIVQPITIDGNDATIVRAANAPDFRIFNIGFGGELHLRDITVQGGRDSSGDGGGAILVASSGTVDIKHSTITDNATTTNGGAIASRGTVTIANVTLSDNTANGANSNGGAIYSVAGRVSIERSRLDHNFARLGGGALYSDSEAFVVINNSAIINNTADTAGGVFVGGNTTITHVTISGNKANTSGGGVRVGVGAPVTIRDSDISGNNASVSGGGVFNTGNLLIEASQLNGNGVQASGGGLYNENVVILRRSQVNGNSAYGPTGQAAGIFNANGSVTLVDSFVTENSATQAPGGVGRNNAPVNLVGNSLIVKNRPTNCVGGAFPITGCFG